MTLVSALSNLSDVLEAAAVAPGVDNHDAKLAHASADAVRTARVEIYDAAARGHFVLSRGGDPVVEVAAAVLDNAAIDIVGTPAVLGAVADVLAAAAAVLKKG